MTQSEYFAIFGFNGTDEHVKLTAVAAPAANGQYNVSYRSGVLEFFNNQNDRQVTAVYSYGGNITIVGESNLSAMYDFVQKNLSTVFTTATGTLYDSYVDIIIGNKDFFYTHR